MSLKELKSNLPPQARTSGSSKGIPARYSEDGLLRDGDEWPPFLPRFAAEVTQAVEAFIERFICQTIQFRCGQLPGDGFVDIFLAQWLNVALHRRRLLDRLLSEYRDRLTFDEADSLLASLRKLESATRDAEQELSRHRCRDQAKTVSFARPLAYRITRRSHDRLSLRSLTDRDDSLANRLSTSTTVIASSAPLQNTYQDRTDGGPPSPPPECPSQTYHWRHSQEHQLAAVPVVVAEDAAGSEEHFTGRASGVFYGAVFHCPARDDRTTTSSLVAEAQPTDAITTSCKSTPQNELDAVVSLWQRRGKRVQQRKRAWYLFVYWMLPMALVTFLACFLHTR